MGALISHKPDGPAPTIRRYDNDRAEAVGVAEAVRLANAAGHRYRNQAVPRTDQCPAGPHRAGAHGAAHPGSGSQRKRTARQPGGEAGVTGDRPRRHRSRTSTRRPRCSTRRAPPTRRLRLRLSGTTTWPHLSRLIHEYVTTDPTPSGPGFLAWINTIGSGDVDRGDDAVDLVTFHGAKGLEWAVVHVSGLEDGFVPVVYAETTEQLAEEQRLLYVALTRAEEHLNLSWADQRTFGTKDVARRPSPVIETLISEIQQLGGTALAPDWRAHITRSRRAIAGETNAGNPVATEPLRRPDLPGVGAMAGSKGSGRAGTTTRDRARSGATGRGPASPGVDRSTGSNHRSAAHETQSLRRGTARRRRSILTQTNTLHSNREHWCLTKPFADRQHPAEKCGEPN